MLQKRARAGLGLLLGKEAIQPRNKSSRPNPPPAQRQTSASSPRAQPSQLTSLSLGRARGVVQRVSSQPIGGGPASFQPIGDGPASSQPIGGCPASLRPIEGGPAPRSQSAAVRRAASWPCAGRPLVARGAGKARCSGRPVEDVIVSV